MVIRLLLSGMLTLKILCWVGLGCVGLSWVGLRAGLLIGWMKSITVCLDLDKFNCFLSGDDIKEQQLLDLVSML